MVVEDKVDFGKGCASLVQNGSALPSRRTRRMGRKRPSGRRIFFLMYGKGPQKWFECFAKEPITTKMVPKVKGVPQVKDTYKEEKKDVKISGVGMEDEHGGRIIELVIDSDREYDLLR